MTVTRADGADDTASWQPAAAAARARAAGGLAVASEDGKTFTITGIPSDAQSCAVRAEIAVYHTVTVTSNTGGTVTAEGLASGKVQVEHGQSLTITATPNNGCGVATIKVDGEDLPKEDFVNNEFTINNVASDVEVNVGFRQKYDIIVYLKQEGLNGTFSIHTNITSGYERSNCEVDTLSKSDNFRGIPGFDLCIEITGIQVIEGAAPSYLYIEDYQGAEILDGVQLINNQGILEIPAEKVTTSFTLVATNEPLETDLTN